MSSKKCVADKPWTDADRDAVRTYLIYTKKKLIVALKTNLDLATKAWSAEADKHPYCALYFESRSPDNLCCISTITRG